MSETHDPWKDVEAELARCREIAAEWGVSPDSVQLSLTPDSLVRLLAARAAEATQHRQEIAAKDETIDGLRLVALGWEKQRDEARARLAAVEAERDRLKAAIEQVAARCRLDSKKLHAVGQHDVAMENAAIAGELETMLRAALSGAEGGGK